MWRVGWIYQKFDCALKPSGQEKYSHPRKQHSWHPLKGHCVRKQPKSKKSLETYFPSLFWNYCSTRQGKGMIPNKRLVSRWEKRAQEIVSPPRKSGNSFLLVRLWIRCTHAQSHAVGKPWWWEGKGEVCFTVSFPKETRPPHQQQYTCHKTMETDMHAIGILMPITFTKGDLAGELSPWDGG